MEKKRVLVTLALLFFAFMAIACVLELGRNTLDNFAHYYSSRDAFKQKNILFDRWHKPLFVLLSFPFSSLLGFFGMKLFNVLLGFGTAYITYLIAKQLKIRNAEHSVWLTLLSPLLFVFMFQSMTDVLFCFLLALIYLLYLKRNYAFASILVSVSIFSREEGIVLFVFFLAFWVYKRAWKPLILMFPLPILFHILNLLVFPQVLWIKGGYYSAFKFSVFYKLITGQQWVHLLYEGLFFDFNNLVYTVGPFIFPGFLLGLGIIVASKKKTKFACTNYLAHWVLHFS
jgi:hypothetical protein